MSAREHFIQVLPAGDCPQKRWGCAVGNTECPGTPTHAIGYMFQAVHWRRHERRGKPQPTRRIMPACLDHARAFAKKHGLALPAAAESGATA